MFFHSRIIHPDDLYTYDMSCSSESFAQMTFIPTIWHVVPSQNHSPNDFDTYDMSCPSISKSLPQITF